MAEPPPLQRVPQHVGIIMDGNGRWAQQRGLPRSAGHRAGTENLRRADRGGRRVWWCRSSPCTPFPQRTGSGPPNEITRDGDHVGWLRDELGKLHQNGVRIRHVVSDVGVTRELLEGIRHDETMTRDNQRLRLNVAFNYGGRADIVHAVRTLVERGLRTEEIDEQAIGAALSTAGLPDVDLIIRTAGEMRLSNFLIWEAAYAEYYSTSAYWPDFDRAELLKALLAPVLVNGDMASQSLKLLQPVAWPAQEVAMLSARVLSACVLLPLVGLLVWLGLSAGRGASLWWRCSPATRSSGSSEPGGYARQAGRAGGAGAIDCRRSLAQAACLQWIALGLP